VTSQLEQADYTWRRFVCIFSELNVNVVSENMINDATIGYPLFLVFVTGNQTIQKCIVLKHAYKTGKYVCRVFVCRYFKIMVLVVSRQTIKHI